MKLIGFLLKSFELIIKHQKQNLKKEKQMQCWKKIIPIEALCTILEPYILQDSQMLRMGFL